MRGSYLLCNKRILFIIPNVRIFRHGYDILVYRMIARSCFNNEGFFCIQTARKFNTRCYLKYVRICLLEV